VRFHLVPSPDIAGGGLSDSLSFRHQSTTPVSHPRGFGLHGHLHDGVNLLRSIGRLPSAPRRDVPKTLRAMFGETGARQGDSLAIKSQ
jgi:hypothetical protein